MEPGGWRLDCLGMTDAIDSSGIAAHPYVDMGEREQPHLLVLLAVTGLLGCAALAIGSVVAAVFVPDYNWISDTISDLGAGAHQRIMDWSLYGFAAGIMATALASAHAHLGKAAWSAGILSLAFIAALVIVIAARDEYGDGDTGGVVIHIYLVYALGALFLLAAWSMAYAIANRHPHAKWALIVLGGLWAVTSAAFLMSSDGIDGLIERIAGLWAAGIIVTLCLVFLYRGRAGRE